MSEVAYLSAAVAKVRDERASHTLNTTTRGKFALSIACQRWRLAVPHVQLCNEVFLNSTTMSSALRLQSLVNARELTVFLIFAQRCDSLLTVGFDSAWKLVIPQI